MRKKQQNEPQTREKPPFQKIPQACATTGLSMCWLRQQARAGEIPCIKSGNTYYINVPALLKKLGAVEE